MSAMFAFRVADEHRIRPKWHIVKIYCRNLTLGGSAIQEKKEARLHENTLSPRKKSRNLRNRVAITLIWQCRYSETALRLQWKGNAITVQSRCLSTVMMTRISVFCHSEMRTRLQLTTSQHVTQLPQESP